MGARLLVAMSLVAGLGYPFFWGGPLSPAGLIALKGSGVGLLALAAALRARETDGRLLAAYLALGAAGDVLLEIDFAGGAASFAAGHLVAILLYRRNRRHNPGGLALGTAALLPAFAAIIVLALLDGRPEAGPFLAYALLLGTMAGTAVLSRFRRRVVFAGAILFLASDMLIAARMAWGADWLSWPIWYLYYAGQLMIFAGVSSSPSEMGRGTRRSLVEG